MSVLFVAVFQEILKKNLSTKLKSVIEIMIETTKKTQSMLSQITTHGTWFSLFCGVYMIEQKIVRKFSGLLKHQAVGHFTEQNVNKKVTSQVIIKTYLFLFFTFFQPSY